MFQIGTGAAGPIGVSIADNGALDAFGRLRVSEPQPKFDTKLLDVDATLFWDSYTTTGGSIAYDANTSSTDLSVDATNDARALRQTFRSFHYQPGESLEIELTGILGNQSDEIRSSIGYFDDNNGIFFSNVDGITYVNIRTNTSGSPVTTSVAQGDWNINNLERLEPAFDADACQIFFIDFQWLGVGRVRLGLVLGGQLVYVHEFNHANTTTNVYMRIPNLPLRYELARIANGATTGTMKQICSAVKGEGGGDPVGVPVTVDTGTTGVATNSTLKPILMFRINSARPNISVLLRHGEIITTTNANARYYIGLNPTFTGTQPTWVDVPNSSPSYIQQCSNCSALTLNSNGYKMGAGYIANASDAIEFDFGQNLRLGHSYTGVYDYIAVCVQNLAGSNETFFGKMDLIVLT